MAYDALGRRIKTIDSIASTTTLYYYNPEWQCLAEYNGAGALQRYFVYGNYIDEPLIMHRQSDAEDYYYGQDHLYSTVVLIDDGGNVVERYEYDAYGTVLVYTDDGNDDTWFTGDDTTASASAKGNPYTFTGRRLDVVDCGSLLRMHYRHRDYDAHAGRFLQHDGLGIHFSGRDTNDCRPLLQYQESMNLYGYAVSQPTIRTDALGNISDLQYPLWEASRPKCCSTWERVGERYLGFYGFWWITPGIPVYGATGECLYWGTHWYEVTRRCKKKNGFYDYDIRLRFVPGTLLIPPPDGIVCPLRIAAYPAVNPDII